MMNSKGPSPQRRASQVSKRLFRKVVLHPHMCPLVRDVATPAIPDRYLLYFFFSFEMSRLDEAPEVLVVMRRRCVVTPAAVRVVFRWMPESFYLPGSYAMTLAATPAEKALMAVQMALSALEVPIEEGMINLGNLRVQTPVLEVAFQAEFFFLVKTNHGYERRAITEFMALQAFLIRYALPGCMTCFAVSYLFMDAAQGAGISGLVIKEKPHGQPCNNRHDHRVKKRFFYGSHRIP